MMKVKINKLGQITIPWLLRASIYAQPGDEFEIEIVGPGRLEMRHLQRHWPWEKPFVSTQADK